MRRALAIVVLLGSSVATLAVASTPFDFGFTPVGGPVRVAAVAGLDTTSADACAGCHAEVAREWRGSMHARSFVDPVFQAELRETAGGAPCRSCHAPLATPSAAADPAHADGISCAACHVRDGTILAARPPLGESPHPVRVVPEFDGVDLCGGCHDFHFPDMSAERAVPYDPDTKQQATVTEWRRSDAGRRGETCAGCHMPTVVRANGRVGRRHGLRSLEDPAFVRTALSVEASARNDADGTHVHLRLTVAGAGHAVPTGDIFRLLRVRVRGSGGSEERTFVRGFAEQHTHRGWVLAESWDGRVQPDAPKSVELLLPTSTGEVRYEIAILRTELDDAARRGLPESTMVIPVAEGVAPIDARRPATR